MTDLILLFINVWLIEPFQLIPLPLVGGFWVSAKFDYTTLHHFIIPFVMRFFVPRGYTICINLTYEVSRAIGTTSMIGIGLALQGFNLIDVTAMALGIYIADYFNRIILIWRFYDNKRRSR